jgi:hypothetical protein
LRKSLSPKTSNFSPRQILARLFRSKWVVPFFLSLFCLAVYNANLRQIGAGDTVPARYLPLILWKYGTFKLGDHANLVSNGHPRYPDRDRPAGADGKVIYCESWTYWLVGTQDHQLASLYPVVAPLIVAPLYLPAIVWLNVHGWEQPNIDRVAEIMEKLSASFLASLACVMMYVVLRRDSGRWSLPIALAFAFGTNTWMISSQALWQHGAGEFFVALALLLAIGNSSRVQIALLGTVCVLMAANRPPDGLIAGAFVAFTVFTQRSKALWLFAGGALPLAAILAYNLDFIGFLGGGYAAQKISKIPFFKLNGMGGLGLLVSPTRGLLVFSPFYLFLFPGVAQRFRTPATNPLALALCTAVVAQLLVYSQADWRAGFSWGPRWLTDLLPILTWFLAPVTLALSALSRFLLIVTMVASVAIQTIGAFWYTRMSDEKIFAGAPEPMSGAWNPHNTPFFVELQQARSRGDLLQNASGRVERIGTARMAEGQEAPLLKSGSTLEGWARAGRGAPAQVFLLLDGIIIGASQDFQPRVDSPLGNNQEPATAWRITVNMQGVTPGKRVLQLAVRIEPRGNLRIVREQVVYVAPQEIPADPFGASARPVADSELAQLATLAASRLREHQSKYGYWLTSYTQKLRYEAPKQEMNTFLTATLIDYLSPVAGRHGLGDVVERARTHLLGQIEENGLVRYHGRPDGPAIGTLGYPITPDSDDTSLAWRISGRGPEDLRFRPMMEILSAYRDARGLYRTWLSPQNAYVNLNPGLDPNPTDIGIQVNICLMLNNLAPPLALELISALERFSDDGDLWIYYSKAPLLPYLRMAQLRQLGYKIQLPSERLALPALGQEIWSDAAFWLVERQLHPDQIEGSIAIDSLLERLGRDKFALIRTSPPMLYHNDQSATVERYYWSEDFGYTLWLRLYEQRLWDREHKHIGPPTRR